MIIIGIDPGSRVTGYGIIRFNASARSSAYVDSGVIKPQAEDFIQRIAEINRAVKQLALRFQPDMAALEDVFVGQNVKSALKLGHARGAAAVALTDFVDGVYSYSPREIKKSVVGYGNADKSQVQCMVQTLLGLDDVPKADAADALAVALCCAHSRALLVAMEANATTNFGERR